MTQKGYWIRLTDSCGEIDSRFVSVEEEQNGSHRIAEEMISLMKWEWMLIGGESITVEEGELEV